MGEGEKEIAPPTAPPGNEIGGHLAFYFYRFTPVIGDAPHPGN